MNADTSDELLTRIKLTSEMIFSILDESDDALDLAQLRQKLEWSAPLFDWALGYLVALGDVEISGSENSVRLRARRSSYPFFARRES